MDFGSEFHGVQGQRLVWSWTNSYWGPWWLVAIWAQQVEVHRVDTSRSTLFAPFSWTWGRPLWKKDQAWFYCLMCCSAVWSAIMQNALRSDRVLKMAAEGAPALWCGPQRLSQGGCHFSLVTVKSSWGISIQGWWPSFLCQFFCRDALGPRYLNISFIVLYIYIYSCTGAVCMGRGLCPWIIEAMLTNKYVYIYINSKL